VGFTLLYDPISLSVETLSDEFEDVSRTSPWDIINFILDGDVVIRVYNIIPEKSPAFDILTGWSGTLRVNRAVMVTFFELYWREQPSSAHPHFPILDQAACRLMFRVALSEIRDDSMVVDGNHGTPAVIKGMLFAISALSARYNNSKGLADFCFRCACRTINYIPNTSSVECVLLNTLLV
jgi:hypothetical protein